MNPSAQYTVSLAFESVSLPPFNDVLILGRKCPHGKAGIAGCLRLLAPDDFEVIDIADERVQAALVNKRLLKRMPQAEIVRILRERVFPMMSAGELIKVDFRVRVSFENIAVRLEV